MLTSGGLGRDPGAPGDSSAHGASVVPISEMGRRLCPYLAFTPPDSTKAAHKGVLT